MAKDKTHVGGFFGSLIRKEEKPKIETPEETIKKLSKIKSPNQKIHYLKSKIKEHSDPKLREELIKIIKEKSKVEPSYHLIYDSFQEGLEPVYFWLLDFLKTKIGYKEIEKTGEEFEASASSSFFGDIGTRKAVMQDRVMKLMETINAIVRSIINLIYDLREFEIRLENYDQLKSKEKEERGAAELQLRSVWMDQVDIKAGRGSINNLAQQLEFVTLRDAFMFAKDLKDVDKMDLNKRVKGILKRKLTEYLKWKEYSEKELRKRYDVEKTYLRSQVAALKQYSKWARPYMEAAKKLEMYSFNSANIIELFNNMQLEITILGKKQINVQRLIEKEELPEKAKTTRKFFQCIEVKFEFRSVPHTVGQGQSSIKYVQGGRVDVYFNTYVFSEDDLKEIKKQNEKEDIDLATEMVDASLVALADDLNKYIEKVEEEEEEKIKKPGIITSFFGGIRKLRGSPRKKGSSYTDKLVVKLGKESAKKDVYTLYDVYKKSHGMLSW